jgi:hypothetical protein
LDQVFFYKESVMDACRAASAVLLLASWATFVLAQEPSIVSAPELVSNWAAPPYWMPATTPVPERISREAVDRAISPDAIQAVPTAPLAFTGINPCRVADTRGNGFSGQYGPPKITPAGRMITIVNVCGIPATAQAVSFNFSAINVPGAGFLVAYPAGGAFPASATMTYNQNTPTLSNAAVVPLGTGGAITVVAGVVSIDLVIDVNGYYAAQSVVTTVNGLSGAVSLSAGTNVTITPSGNNLTIASTGGGGSAWSLTGNSGTTAGTNFVGTTDNQALEMKVNGSRALRLEPVGGSPYPNVIGGFSSNAVTSGRFGAAIGGGLSNTVTESGGVISGGEGNQAGFEAAVGGGNGNIASGTFSAIPGGAGNSATGMFSFAGGNQAHALHDWTFVWSDGQGGPQGGGISSTGPQQFLVRANGGAIFLRTAQAPHGTGSALQVEQQSTTGEAAWLYAGNTSSGVQSAVIRLLKHPSATNKNFLECTDFDGSTAPVANKCHINAAGTFVNGSDFAEALPARGGKASFEPGDVLVVSRNGRGTVETSAARYDRRAIGVYSTRPGFLGADKDGDVRVDAQDIPVAITGIVPTKATSENGPIEPGDLLTTSSTPGYAMKATPVSVEGVEIYPAGTILGKALTPLIGERGKIRMLVLPR